MTNLYKTAYSGTYFVAIKVNQDPPGQVHAPDHESFKNEKGPLHTKCPNPNCDAYYSIGHGKRNPPNKTFEMLAEQLRAILMHDHSNFRSHELAIPLG
jgi:hypothetical protein